MWSSEITWFCTSKVAPRPRVCLDPGVDGTSNKGGWSSHTPAATYARACIYPRLPRALRTRMRVRDVVVQNDRFALMYITVLLFHVANNSPGARLSCPISVQLDYSPTAVRASGTSPAQLWRPPRNCGNRLESLCPADDVITS